MEVKYSKEPFDGYTHRFIVNLNADNKYITTIDIYSNSENRQKLLDFICENKSRRLLSYYIEKIVTKEQDDIASQIIDELFGSDFADLKEA